MPDIVKIDKLDLVERVLIPMNNLSQGLKFIMEGQPELSHSELMAGLTNVRAQAEKINQYIYEVKDGVAEERHRRLPRVIAGLASEMIQVESMNSFGKSDTTTLRKQEVRSLIEHGGD